MADLKPESAHDEFLRLFRARDLDGLVALYEDDPIMVAADGSTQSGKAVVREALAGFLALGGTMDLKTRYAARAAIPCRRPYRARRPPRPGGCRAHKPAAARDLP